MKPETAFSFYISLKKHFQTKKYNIFKDGVLHIPTRTWDAIRPHQKRIFIDIVDSYKEKSIVMQYILAQFVYDEGNLFAGKDIRENLYRQWVSDKQRMTKIILDDIEEIDYPSCIDLEYGKTPSLLFDVLCGKRKPFVVVALDRFEPFLEKWEECPLGSGEVLKLQKLKFIKFNEEKVYNRLKEKYAERI